MHVLHVQSNEVDFVNSWLLELSCLNVLPGMEFLHIIKDVLQDILPNTPFSLSTCMRYTRYVSTITFNEINLLQPHHWSPPQSSYF